MKLPDGLFDGLRADWNHLEATDVHFQQYSLSFDLHYHSHLQRASPLLDPVLKGDLVLIYRELHLRPYFQQHSNLTYAEKLCALTLTSRLASVLRKPWIQSSLVNTSLSHLSLYSSRSIRWHYRQLVEVIHKLRKNEYQVVPQKYSSQPLPCALQPHIHPGQLVLRRLPLELSCSKRPP